MTYFLVGGAAVPNYGDELIAKGWIEWYSSAKGLSKSRSLVVQGNHDGVMESFFPAQHPGVVFDSGVSALRWRLRGASFASAVEFGARFFVNPSDDPVVLRVRRMLESSSVFHLFGGGYLNDAWPSHGFSLGLGLAAKRHVGARLVATGLGVGPLHGDADRLAAQRAFLDFDFVEFRDQVSFDLVGASAGHVVGLDDAYLQSPRVRPVEGRCLHLALIGDSSDGDLLDALPFSFLEEFDHLCLWLSTANEGVLYSKFGSGHRRVRPYSVWELLDGIPVGSGGNFMLASRYHAHLMGARLGMAGMVCSLSKYYDQKHAAVFRLGSRFASGGVEQVAGLDSLAATDAARSVAMADGDLERVRSKRAMAEGILEGA